MTAETSEELCLWQDCSPEGAFPKASCLEGTPLGSCPCPEVFKILLWSKVLEHACMKHPARSAFIVRVTRSPEGDCARLAKLRQIELSCNTPDIILP